MRNQLTPTTITDKNGKVTTVHRRDKADLKRASSLAGIKPSLSGNGPSSGAKDDHKPIKVKWKTSQGSLPMSENSFLERVGLKDDVLAADIKREGHEMTRSEVFEFMKLGISFYEAAALHQIGGPLGEWVGKPEFQSALPGDYARVFVDGSWQAIALDDTVELIKSEGVTFSKSFKLIKNGLSDELVHRSVLAPHEIVALFSRFSYQPSINPDVATNSTATINALNEGRLPFDLAENTDVDKATMTAVIYALYPPDKKKATTIPLAPDAITEDIRAELLSDPEKLSKTIRIMSRYTGRGGGERMKSITTTVDALNKFGYVACMEHHPGILSHTMSDGTTLGTERATKAKELTLALGNMMTPNRITNYPEVLGMHSTVDGQRVYLEYSDIAEFQLLGMSDQEIFERTIGSQMNSNRALAIVQNHVTPAVSSGWL